MQIRPEPSDDEAAAIAAAIEMAMTIIAPQPRTVVVSPVWRFRGRWWNRDRAKGR